MGTHLPHYARNHAQPGERRKDRFGIRAGMRIVHMAGTAQSQRNRLAALHDRTIGMRGGDRGPWTAERGIEQRG